MKLTKWIDKRGVQFWTRDKTGKPSQMVFGARKNENSKLPLPDYTIETTRRSREWIEEHYGMRL